MSSRMEEAYFSQAEHLYVNENKTPEEIAALIPPCLNTIYKWRTKGGWEAKRRAKLTEPQSISDMLMTRLEGLIKAFQVKEGMTTDDLMALPGIADAICKTVSSLKKLEKNYDNRAVLVVMSKYADFLRSPEQQISLGELQLHSERMQAFFKSVE